VKGSQDNAFKHELKQLIIETCDKQVAPEAVADDAVLFGDGSVLELDSVDGLQISMALQKRYGVRITDGKEMRRIFTSVNALADYLRPS
jgi:acyl carrier protein